MYGVPVQYSKANTAVVPGMSYSEYKYQVLYLVPGTVFLRSPTLVLPVRVGLVL
jgi:hypothetical protein